MTAPRHIVLLGLMGAGKTTVGRVVAAELGWSLSDSDEVIERVHGATVRELAERLGIDAMHRLEATHLLDALDERHPSVVCAAASVVDVARCRARLRRPAVLAVWLEAPPRALADRFAAGVHRPLLDIDVLRLLERQAQERSARFAALSPLRVNGASRSPEQIAQDILSEVRVR